MNDIIYPVVDLFNVCIREVSTPSELESVTLYLGIVSHFGPGIRSHTFSWRLIGEVNGVWYWCSPNFLSNRPFKIYRDSKATRSREGKNYRLFDPIVHEVEYFAPLSLDSLKSNSRNV